MGCYFTLALISPSSACRGNLLATPAGDLCYLDFGMMSEAPENARYAIIAHVVHLVNRDYEVCLTDFRSGTRSVQCMAFCNYRSVAVVDAA